MQSQEDIRQLILKELPRIIENDPEVQRLILSLSKQQFADKDRTEDRIERILDELRADRERQDAKWEANQKTINEMLENIRSLSRKHDTTIGALG